MKQSNPKPRSAAEISQRTTEKNNKTSASLRVGSVSLRAIALLLILAATACEQKKVDKPETSPLQSKIDSLIQPWLDSSKFAGVAIAVYKDNQPVMLKSYGFADIEHDVKLPVTASFEIGSVTKQFTCVAILQLLEQGKLSLDDDFTKYVKYNTKGKKVTIYQLMNHTSGIKGYTEIQEFETISPFKLERDTLLRIVEKKEFDFEPGTALIYNNTGFFILGLIIEKVSGMSYEDYVKKNVFDKAGMSNSYYCSSKKIVKGKATGYDSDKEGLVRAMYLDHTWPYAAGSLCSTPEDLAKWNDALHNGKVLSEPMYKLLIEPAKLSDGTVTRYAAGLSITKENGKTKIEHGGGIPGFLTANVYYPEDKISISVLMNSIGSVSPGTISEFVSKELLGEDPDEPGSFSGDLSKFTGTYNGASRGDMMILHVMSNDTTLQVQRYSGDTTALKFRDNQWKDGNIIYNFVEHNGVVDELRIDQVYGYLIMKKTK